DITGGAAHQLTQGFEVRCDIPYPYCRCTVDISQRLTFTYNQPTTPAQTLTTFAAPNSFLTSISSLSDPSAAAASDSINPPKTAAAHTCSFDWTCGLTMTVRPLWIFFEPPGPLLPDGAFVDFQGSCNNPEQEMF